MQAAEITLAAALTDSRDRVQAVRHRAVRNLAPALLAELGRPGPAWDAASDHPRGEEVLAALREAIAADDDAAIAGMAAIGLGWIGAAEVVEWTASWLDEDDGDSGRWAYREGENDGDDDRVEQNDDDPRRGFLRECAVIAISYIGAAAHDHEAPIVDTITTRLRAALRSPRADLRFQAAIALVEVAGDDAESDVLAALAREREPEVRAQLVAALSRLDPPSARALGALERLLADERDRETAFEAALVLAAAHRPSAGPRLIAALGDRAHRDRALEALAVLAPELGAEARTAVRTLATWPFVPAITRVRAAYALARFDAGDGGGNAGNALLRWLAWHPRPAVREAVRDAEAALRELASR